MIGIAITIAYLLIGGYIAIVRTKWEDDSNETMDFWFIGLGTILLAVMWPFVVLGRFVMKVQKK